MNKLTKLLSVFILAGAVGAGVAGVAACKKDDGDGSGHKHNYEYIQIEGNDQKHTVHCKNDGHEGGDTQEDHHWVNGKCDKCDYSKPAEGVVAPAGATGIMTEWEGGLTDVELSDTVKTTSIDLSKLKVYYKIGSGKGAAVPVDNYQATVSKDGNIIETLTELKQGHYEIEVVLTGVKKSDGSTANWDTIDEMTVTNPVKAGSLAVKTGATLAQVQSVQDKMTSTWTYEVTLANGDKQDVPAADVTISGLNTNTVSESATANLAWGTITGTVTYKITENANLRVQSYAANMSVFSSQTTDEAFTDVKTLIDNKEDGSGTLLQVVPGNKAKFSSGTAETEDKYLTRRVQFGGGTYTQAGAIQTNKRYFTLKTEGPAKLTVIWNTNGSAGRGIKVYSKTALGEGGIDATTSSSEALFSEVAVDTEIKQSVITLNAAGEYYITTANDGDVYFFYFQVDTEFEDPAVTNVQLEDGEAKLAKLSVKSATADYKQTFTVGSNFSVSEEYSFEGTYATVNTGKKTKQTFTTGLTYWLGEVQLTIETVLSDVLITTLGEQKVTVKYNEETVTGSYTIVVESAVSGVTGITASVSGLTTELENADATATLNLSNIQAVITGTNANATVEITSVKYKVKGADDSTLVAITAGNAAQLGKGDYVIVVVANVTDTVANKNADFETTCELSITVAGEIQDIKYTISAEDVSTVGSTASTVENTLLDNSDGKIVVGTNCKGGANNITVNEVAYSNRIQLGGTFKIADAPTNAIAITVKEACTVKVIYNTSSNGNARTLSIYDSEGNKTAAGTALDGAAMVSYTIGAAGTYYLGSEGSGINVWYIEIDYTSNNT